jgi:hypothetical protein
MQLLAWRLRFYGDVSVKLLIRRWQFWLFLAFAVSPATMPLAAQIHVAGLPVRNVIEGYSPAYSMTAWLALGLIASAWTAVQADALRGGAQWRYLQAMPGILSLEHGIDFAVILLADLPLLLPFAAYLISIPQSPLDGLLAFALALQWPLLQLLLLRNRPGASLIAVASTAGVLTLCSDTYRPYAMIYLTAGPLAALHLTGHHADYDLPAWNAAPAPSRVRLNQRSRPVLNLLKIDLLILGAKSERTSLLGLVFYAFALPGLIGQSLTAGLKPQFAYALLLAGTIPLAFHVAALESRLQSTRASALPLLNSLGIDWRRLFLADLCLLELGYGLLALPSAAQALSMAGMRGSSLLPIGAAAVALLARHHARTGHLKILPKALIAILMAAAYWAML